MRPDVADNLRNPRESYHLCILHVLLLLLRYDISNGREIYCFKDNVMLALLNSTNIPQLKFRK